MSQAMLLTLGRSAAVLTLGLLATWSLLAAAAPQQAAPEAPAAPAEPPPQLMPVQDPPSITVPADGSAAPPAIRTEQPADDARWQRIQDALRGGDAESSTGDPILDDVLGVIRASGSVLDGTALDASAAAAIDADVAVDPVAEQRYRVAESLLRTARLLSGLPDPDGRRQALMRQMRAEASRCLTAP